MMNDIFDIVKAAHSYEPKNIGDNNFIITGYRGANAYKEPLYPFCAIYKKLEISLN